MAHPRWHDTQDCFFFPAHFIQYYYVAIVIADLQRQALCSLVADCAGKIYLAAGSELEVGQGRTAIGLRGHENFSDEVGSDLRGSDRDTGVIGCNFRANSSCYSFAVCCTIHILTERKVLLRHRYVSCFGDRPATWTRWGGPERQRPNSDGDPGPETPAHEAEPGSALARIEVHPDRICNTQIRKEHRRRL
eukprot:scaffold203510_cov31-Prasinocladus_malaysianus.AAC.1